MILGTQKEGYLLSNRHNLLLNAIDAKVELATKCTPYEVSLSH